MKIWKSKEIPKRHDVFTSEIRLKVISQTRYAKVKKLIKLLGGDENENLS